MRSALLLIVLAVTFSAHADIYRIVHPDGTVEFTDEEPAEGGEKIELPPPMIYEAPELERAPLAAVEEQTAAEPEAYEELVIERPEHDAAVRSNVGDVTVRVRVSPSLEEEHSFQAVLDGEVLDQSFRSGRLELLNLARGTHTVQVRIVDEAGNVIPPTASVTFHLQRYSPLLAPDGQEPRPPPPGGFGGGAVSPPTGPRAPPRAPLQQ